MRLRLGRSGLGRRIGGGLRWIPCRWGGCLPLADWWWSDVGVARVWISFETAAEILGCSVGTVTKYARQGRFVRPDRDQLRGKPSLALDSVLEFREQRITEQLAREKRRQRRDTGPPDREHRWLRSTEVAEVLGISRSRVDQLVREGRVPFTRSGKLRWFRAEDIRVLRKARAFHAMVSTVTTGAD